MPQLCYSAPSKETHFFINSGGDYTLRAKFLLHVSPLRQRLYPGDGSALPVQTAHSRFFVLLETKEELFSYIENIKETCCLPAQNKTLEMQSETMRNELFLSQRQRSGLIFKIHSKIFSVFWGRRRRSGEDSGRLHDSYWKMSPGQLGELCAEEGLHKARKEMKRKEG